MIKKLFIVSLLSIATYHLEAVVAIGTDSTTGAPTFPFSIGSAIFNAGTSSMWTASGEDISSADDSVKKYGISYTPFISSKMTTLIAYPNLTPTAIVSEFTTSLTVTQGLDNPLYGKAFSALTLAGSNPTVVLTSEPRSIYFMQSVVFSDKAQGLNSEEGSSIINKLEYASGQQVHEIAGIGSSNLLAARAPGAFGTVGSKLSYVHIINDTSTGTTYSYMQEQASTSVALNTPVLTAGTAPLLNIHTSVAMYPFGTSMLVGLDLNSALIGSAVSLFLAKGVNAQGDTPGSLTFSSIMSDDVANNADNISTPISVSSASGGLRVAVRNISTTTTSTGLGYLFVASDNGSDAQSIYAMPMVTMPKGTSNEGMIADFNSIQKSFQRVGYDYRTQGFDTPITEAQVGQIDIDTSDAVVLRRILVGGGAVPVAAGGFIEQLSVQGDAVYITIQDAFATGTTPGMFKSGAIFDSLGRIMSWSAWQRVAGTDDQMLFAIKDRISSETMFVSGATSNTVQQTTWTTTNTLDAFITTTNGALPSGIGGVQGIIPFPSSISGFTSLPTAKVSLVAATGNNNVVIAQTGILDTTTQTFQILPQTSSTSITIDSSFGLAIGSVVTADFGNDNAGDNWLFMGGDGGLAVLANGTTGIGFTGDLPNIAASEYLIAAGQVCTTLGNFKFVKKIVYDGGYLYVMTQDAVYRILLVSTKFTVPATAPLDAIEIVTAAQFNANSYCLDMLVDGGVILLGTTAGLYSINLRTGLPGVLTSISVPLGLPAVSRLQSVSFNKTIGFGQIDYGFYSSSNLYVLSIDFATEQARLNRFTITDGVVTPIQDQLIENQNGPLVVFDYMSNNMFIDGTLGFMTSYRMGNQAPTVKYLQYILQAGRSGSQYSLRNNTTDISIRAIINSLGITGVNRDPASGCLMLAADFGLLANS